MNWAEFFHMGGYAFEVWTSWSLTLIVLVWFVISPKLKNAKIKREISRQIAREQRVATAVATSLATQAPDEGKS